MHRHARAAFLSTGLLVFGFGSAAALVPIGGAVIGSGQLGVESRVKRVAHPTGGVVAAIEVKDGDHVRRGQPLLRLDNRVAGTDADLSALTVDQLLAQRGRLDAERLGLSAIRFDPALAARNDQAAIQAMADETRLFELRRQELSGMTAQLDARLAQYRQQIVGLGQQITALRRQQDLIGPEREGVDRLYRKGLVTIARRNQLERNAAELQGAIGALQASIAETGARMSETREQRAQLMTTRRSGAADRLAAIESELNRQRIRAVGARDAAGRSVIRAPYDGVVDKVAFAAIGDVVKPAETILEIVPDADRLVVEGAVSPTDIDQVRLGQPARIRFSAFNSATTPEAAGSVVAIGAERTTDAATGRSYFKVRVRIEDKDFVRRQGLSLRAGMPAELFIETNNRTMLSYLLKPITDQFARAFRDG